MIDISFNRIWIKAVNSDESKAKVIPLLNQSYLNKSAFAPIENGFIRLPGTLSPVVLIKWKTIEWSNSTFKEDIENMEYKILNTTSTNYYSCNSSQLAIIALGTDDTGVVCKALKGIVRVANFNVKLISLDIFKHSATFVNHGYFSFETL